MIIDARRGAKGTLTDLDTGQLIRWPIWGNLETGEYEAFRIDPKQAKARGIPLAQVRYKGRARLRFTPTANLGASASLPPAPALPTGKVRGVLILFQERYCEHRTCWRLADWQVSVEIAGQPIEENGRRFEQAATIEVHFFCWRHWQPPKTQHPDGSRSIITGQAQP